MLKCSFFSKKSQIVSFLTSDGRPDPGVFSAATASLQTPWLYAVAASRTQTISTMICRLIVQ